MKRLISNNKGIALGVVFALGLIEIALAWVFDKYAAELALSGIFTVMIVAINSVGLIAEHFEDKEDKYLSNRTILNLRAVDFRNTEYSDYRNCAITKAIRRQLGEELKVGTSYAELKHTYRFKYVFERYGYLNFKEDAARAKTLKDKEIVRTIILKKRDSYEY